MRKANSKHKPIATNANAVTPEAESKLRDQLKTFANSLDGMRMFFHLCTDAETTIMLQRYWNFPVLYQTKKEKQ